MFSDWLQNRKRTMAIVCDIDDTICHCFDQPIEAACAALRGIDSNIEVFYVTSRPEKARTLTEELFEEHRLPGARNIHFCPEWKASRKHKTETTAQLALEYRVILCIGDADEDEHAAKESGIAFVRVVKSWEEDAWRQAVILITNARLGKI